MNKIKACSLIFLEWMFGAIIGLSAIFTIVAVADLIVKMVLRFGLDVLLMTISASILFLSSWAIIKVNKLQERISMQ